MLVKKENRQEEVKTIVNKTVFVLELNEDELAALVAVLGKVGGHVEKDNPRDHTDKIYREASGKVSNLLVSKYGRNVRQEALMVSGSYV